MIRQKFENSASQSVNLSVSYCACQVLTLIHSLRDGVHQTEPPAAELQSSLDDGEEGGVVRGEAQAGGGRQGEDDLPLRPDQLRQG